MKRELTRRLLLYIVDQLQDKEGQISTIRLVKLLYLIDLDFFIRHSETLTGIDWVYYHYGPYFFELGAILRSASIDLDMREFVSTVGKGFTFKSLEEQSISDLVDFTTEQQINRIINRWALEETPILLRYVYDTAPVRLGQRGQPLDFGLVFQVSDKKDKRITNITAYRLMLASESVLAKEWDTPEEDEAWAYLSKRAK